MTWTGLKQPRARSRKYLDSFRDRACEACGHTDGTTIPAHCSIGLLGGIGIKAPDWAVAALCGPCHFIADEGPILERLKLWVKVLQTLMRARYEIFREESK